nr:hypothetical protein [Candidatus Sigynarchaeota archaeon]
MSEKPDSWDRIREIMKASGIEMTSRDAVLLMIDWAALFPREREVAIVSAISKDALGITQSDKRRKVIAEDVFLALLITNASSMEFWNQVFQLLKKKPCYTQTVRDIIAANRDKIGREFWKKIREFEWKTYIIKKSGDNS